MTQRNLAAGPLSRVRPFLVQDPAPDHVWWVARNAETRHEWSGVSRSPRKAFCGLRIDLAVRAPDPDEAMHCLKCARIRRERELLESPWLRPDVASHRDPAL